MVEAGDNDHEEHDDHYVEYYVEDSNGHMKRGKGKKGKGKRKKQKGSKKIFKKMQPVLIGLGGLKLVLYHLFLKEMALTTALSFILSKVSFVLATLVALKQFFHTPTHHRSSDSSKLEVVHIPIKKFHGHHRDKDYDESQFIPVTFPPEFNTTPFFYDFPYSEQNPGAFFNNGEVNFDGNFGSDFDTKFSENSEIKFSEPFGKSFKYPGESQFGEVFPESLTPSGDKFKGITVENPPKFSDNGGFFSSNSDFGSFDDQFDSSLIKNSGDRLNSKPKLPRKPIFGEKIAPSLDVKLKKAFDGKLKNSFKPQSNKNPDEKESFGDIYNEHFQSKLSAASDKIDEDEKSFYKNHVHSPFV